MVLGNKKIDPRSVREEENASGMMIPFPIWVNKKKKGGGGDQKVWVMTRKENVPDRKEMGKAQKW